MRQERSRQEYFSPDKFTDTDDEQRRQSLVQPLKEPKAVPELDNSGYEKLVVESRVATQKDVDYFNAKGIVVPGVTHSTQELEAMRDYNARRQAEYDEAKGLI